MLGHVTKIASSFYKIPIQSYSKFTVTAHESVCGTIKIGHPAVLKQECGTPVCNEKNCTKDVTECDPNTLKTFRVGHKVNSVSGVETDKKVYHLEKYLIIRHENKQILFDLNSTTVKEHSQEKLNLYAARFMLFKETYSYTMSTIHYENKYIKPFFNPLFISTLKIFSNLLYLNINNIVFLGLFIAIAIKEYYNIKQEIITLEFRI